MILALKSSPMFAKHEELFDESMDDGARKKLMQKIRNRVSAQESRDRRKAQFSNMEKITNDLRKANESLKRRVSNLEMENQALRMKMSEHGIDSTPFVTLKKGNNFQSLQTASTRDNDEDIESIKSEEVSKF